MIIGIVNHVWFDRIVLIVIVINCGFLASDNPNKPETYVQKVADNIFLILYTIECILKIIAKGFALQPYSYLRDAWNILDFLVLLMGWLSKVIKAKNVSAVRVVRILRPLRTINSLAGMKHLVQGLLSSLP